MRVAILHYTGPGTVGGVEQVIASQVQVLRDLGHDVRLVVGSVPLPNDPDATCIPELDPQHPAVRDVSPENLRRLETKLWGVLRGCDLVIVHNAFTLPSLNPRLTRALADLVNTERGRQVGSSWIGWAHDVEEDVAPLPTAFQDVCWVSDSFAGRRELAEKLGVEAERVHVVSPPFAIRDWLDEDTKRLFDELDLGNAYPLVLVPAKLLPHKNLHKAVELAAALRRLAERPLVIVSGAASGHQRGSSQALADALEGHAKDLLARDAFVILGSLLGGEPPPPVMKALLWLADLIFLPSFKEGFGLPLLEAMATRTPLLVSDIPVFREVTGESATYFGLDEPIEPVAKRVMEIATEDANGRRHHVMGSMKRFEGAMRELLDAAMSTPGTKP